MREDLPRIIITGAVLGVVCATIVWWLERFQTDRLVGQLRNHLDTMSDEYKSWLAQRPGHSPGGS